MEEKAESYFPKDALAVELQLLDRLLDVCKNNNLHIYIDGGTLLGAVRHKGYIPWDDDIDLLMPREDYDRLIQIGPEAFEKPVLFQSYQTDTEYYRTHIQLRMDGTAGFIPEELVGAKFHQGIFIDVFPLDRVPKSPVANWLQWMRICLIRKCMNLIYSQHVSGSFLKRLLHKVAYWFFRPLLPLRFLHKRLEKVMTSASEDSGWATLLCINRHINQNLLDLHWYDETVYLDFEGRKVPAPGCYHQVLAAKYGPYYMTPKNSGTLHGRLVLDANMSYTEYQKRKQESKYVIW